MAQRHRELHSGGARSGDRDARERLPAQPGEETFERLHRHGVLAAGGGRLDRRADIQRQKIVAELGPVVQPRSPRSGIELRDRAQRKLRIGARGEARNVDADLVQPVVARDEAGQHSRVDLHLAGRDERYARAVQRLPCEIAENGEVRVAGSDKQDALHACLSFASSRLRSSFLCTFPVVVMGSASMNSISRGYS